MSSGAGNDRPDVVLGRILGDLRKRASLSQSAAARGSGVHQAEISRMESGRSRITVERVTKLLTAYAAVDDRLTPEHVAELTAEARRIEEQFADRRIHLQAGQPLNFALRTLAAEESAQLMRSYQPLMVLGVLQTREYANAVFGAGADLTPQERERVVRERTKRWESLRREPSRRWVLIQTEWSLRSPIGSYALQADQLEQLLVASELPNVRLGVLPLDTVAPHPVAVTGFHLYDERELVVGTDVGAALTTAPEHVAAYAERFALLERMAVFDEDVRALLRRIIRHYRDLA